MSEGGVGSFNWGDFSLVIKLISIQRHDLDERFHSPPLRIFKIMPGDKALQMNAVKTRIGRLLSNAPGRLYRGLPSILLGTLFNVLDAVSTGLLLFPNNNGKGVDQFKSLQIEGLSMYILSTVLSQVAMTLGGSQFPGAMGAMLIEILPFLRGVGSDIRDALGNDNPALIPTVFAAYALTSFLTGFLFVVLGLLKLGNLVAYFPQTVLTGAIGAIGLSLFILGLELTIPESSPPLTLSSAGTLLFNVHHLPILVAAILPPLLLSISKRSKLIERLSRGLVHNPYYVPLYLASIPALFWIIAGSMKLSKDDLVRSGWLFSVPSSQGQSGIGTDWIYWREFNFPKVEWWALRNAITNIVLLVVIGVLNLPIYVPALAFTLDVPYDMNHEFLGQGAANILAGVAGTVPNILQYSYGVFITRAGGGRIELGIVTVFTFILFLTSSLLLPYVPTILAAGMVMFLGIELMIEAVWESAHTLVLLEYLVVLGTLLACTFAGFAPGFGIGIATAAVVYLAYGVVDSRARVLQWDEWNETHKHLAAGSDSSIQQMSSLDCYVPISPLSHMPSPQRPRSESVDQEAQLTSSSVHSLNSDILDKIRTKVIVLTGYVFFASIPTFEANVLDEKDNPSTILVDVTTVHRLETAAAQCFDRAVRDLAPRDAVLIVAGIRKGSGVHADFERAGVSLLWNDDGANDPNCKGLRVFENRVEALAWCKARFERTMSLSESDKKISEADSDYTYPLTPAADIAVYESFCTLFDFDLNRVVKIDEKEQVADSVDITPAVSRMPSSITLSNSSSKIRKFFSAGGRMVSYNAGKIIKDSNGIAFLVSGSASLHLPSSSPSSQSHTSRLALRDLLMMLPKETLLYAKERAKTVWPWSKTRPIKLSAGAVVMLDDDTEVVARSKCVCVYLDNTGEGELARWAKEMVERKGINFADRRELR